MTDTKMTILRKVDVLFQLLIPAIVVFQLVMFGIYANQAFWGEKNWFNAILHLILFAMTYISWGKTLQIRRKTQEVLVDMQLLEMISEMANYDAINAKP